jgi:glucose-1-phosphate thymidylyltransferase
MSEVKGVLLCGGEGTRLYPLTKVANKHLQRIGKKVMLDYPFEKMIEAGIKKFHIIVGGENWAQVPKYLGSGKDRGVDISYSIQDKAGGIAEAIGLAETFAGNDKILTILGDNLFDMSLRTEVKLFAESDNPSESKLFSRRVKDPSRFGVLTRNETGQLKDIVEKPKEYLSDEILTGIYMYTPDVFDIIRTIQPSARGELEVSDLNRWYIQGGCASVVDMTGNWTDCGTFESLAEAERIVSERNGQ